LLLQATCCQICSHTSRHVRQHQQARVRDFISMNGPRLCLCEASPTEKTDVPGPCGDRPSEVDTQMSASFHQHHRSNDIFVPCQITVDVVGIKVRALSMKHWHDGGGGDGRVADKADKVSRADDAKPTRCERGSTSPRQYRNMPSRAPIECALSV
jgi:hypothetical protein